MDSKGIVGILAVGENYGSAPSSRRLRRSSAPYLSIRSPIKHKKHATTIDACFPFGGLEGDRTLDLTDANRTLSQLSYEPIFCTKIILPQDFIVKTLLCEQKMKDCKMVFFVVK